MQTQNQEDIRPRPTHWRCQACGTVMVVDESAVPRFVAKGRTCIQCGEPSTRITKANYDKIYRAAVAAIKPTTKEDIERFSAELDRGIRLGARS